MQQPLLTRTQAWQALMTISRVNGQRIMHRTIVEMAGALHCIVTLADGCTTVEIILPHSEETEENQ